MIRFLSVHWNPLTAPAAHYAMAVRNRVTDYLPQWQTIAKESGFCVYCPSAMNPDEVNVLPAKGGVLLGTFFRRSANSTPSDALRASHLREADLESIRRSAGRILIEEFWGSYIAILSNPSTGTSFVLRSPCSREKCFYHSRQGVHLFFSHVDDYASLDLSPLTINWDCIRAEAACSEYLGRETAIGEVQAMEWGECIATDDDQVRSSFFWNPCEIAARDNIANFDAAKDELRQSTEMCVQSWAKHYGLIVHQLSGGLDSSISVAIARKCLPRSSIIGVNFYSKSRVGDERHYARAVAQSIDIDLIEWERDASVDLSIFQECRGTAWPVLDFSGYGQYRKEAQFARQSDAKAIFCGELGDNLFENDASFQAPADYVWRRGIGPELLPVAIDCAIRRNFSVWKSLYRAIRDGLKHATTARWSTEEYLERELGLHVADHTLLRQEALQSVRQCAHRFVHPWLEKLDETPPAKFMMIYGMYTVSSYDPPFAMTNDPPLVAPLASQPIAEVCLRTPTYFNNRGGMDRAVARHAFANDLPASTIRRITKGGPDAWTRDVVRRNQDFLKEFLLGGILVSQGILDPGRIEGVIAGKLGESKSYISDLILQVYIEAWLRRWTTRYALNLAA